MTTTSTGTTSTEAPGTSPAGATTAGTVTVERTVWDDPRVAALRDAMDAEIGPRYAHLQGRSRPPAVQAEEIVASFVAVVDGEAVATASLKRTGAFAEVKRVYVHPHGRRRGLASLLLAAVEQEALAAGYPEVHLQTGKFQPEAQSAYERNGWTPVAPFGPYAGDTEISRCYAKALRPLLVAAHVPATLALGDAAGTDVIDAAVAYLVALDAAGVDVALLDDTYTPEAGTVSVDAPTLAAVAAGRTSHLVLAPRVPVTHTEPFHVSKVVQTLDWVSAGRAGWVVDVSTTDAEALAFGRRAAPAASEAWREAQDAVVVSRLLWDSWEDDAEIRDVATGRFVDRDKIHHLDFEGEWFSVKGPSIVPRSPQGQVPVIVDVPAAGTPEDVRTLLAATVEHVDVVRVRGAVVPGTGADVAAGDVPAPGDATGHGAATVAQVRAAATAAGRTDLVVLLDVLVDEGALAALAGPLPEGLAPDRLLASLAVGWRGLTGADGIVLVGDGTDVLSAARTVASVQPGAPGTTAQPGAADAGTPQAASTPHAAGTLRDRLGLARPLSRYTTERAR